MNLKADSLGKQFCWSKNRIRSSNHMFGRVICDKLPEWIFENFEIARGKRGKFQNFQKSRG